VKCKSPDTFHGRLRAILLGAANPDRPHAERLLEPTIAHRQNCKYETFPRVAPGRKHLKTCSKNTTRPKLNLRKTYRIIGMAYRESRLETASRIRSACDAQTIEKVEPAAKLMSQGPFARSMSKQIPLGNFTRICASDPEGV
jgi:hypothetical protein